jgi:hypothetical protein
VEDIVNAIPMEGVSMASVGVKRDIPGMVSKDVTVSLLQGCYGK